MTTPHCSPPTSSTLKVPYGLRNGAVLHISEIQPSERGRACQCVCPACQHPLVANLGSKKRHYFSHAAQSNCAYAAETGLHLKAKELIAERGFTVLPELTLSVGSDHSDEARHEGRFETATLVKKGTVARFDSVLVEQARGIIRPDVIGVLSGTELYIEIRVTHEVDEAKRDEIRRQAVSTIEIDLSGIDRMASPQVIAKAISNPSLVDWVYHRREDRLRNEMTRRVQQAEQRFKESEARKVARRQQAKEAFKQRLSDLFRALNQRLLEGVPVNLPGVSQEPEIPQVTLPEGFGEGLSIGTIQEDWMVWAKRADYLGEEERFIIAWDLYNPDRRRPFRLGALFNLEAPFCILDVSPLIKGRYRSGWSHEELDAFLAAPRPRHDHWYREPDSITRIKRGLLHDKRLRDQAESQVRIAEKQKAEAEREARQRAAMEAIQKEQAKRDEQKKIEQRQQEARFRDNHLKHELGKLRPLNSKGQVIHQKVLARLEEIRIAREASDTPVPARWHPVKELSAKYPPLDTAQADWISDRWKMVARPYPYEWAFTIHPDYLKIAILDSVLPPTGDHRALKDPGVQDALQRAFQARLEQTRQPGSQAKGYGSLYLQMTRWVREVEICAKRVNHWLFMTHDGVSLPESEVTREAHTELDAVYHLMAQAAGIPDRAVITEGEEWGKLDVSKAFCAALREDLVRVAR